MLVLCGLLYHWIFVFRHGFLHLKVHFKLSIHIFIMSVRQIFTEIQVVLFTWRKLTETKMDESAPCLFSLFYKSTLFCCNYDYTQIKVGPLQFQTMPYTYLYDQMIKRLWSIFSYFCDHQEKNVTNRTGAVFDPKGLMWCDGSDHLLLLVIAQCSKILTEKNHLLHYHPINVSTIERREWNSLWTSWPYIIIS